MKRQSDYCSDTTHCEAEIVRVAGEEIIVEKRVDVIADKAKKKFGPWLADWSGCEGIKGFGVNGNSREEVIKKMGVLISRKRKVKELREWIMRRKLQRETVEMLRKH